MAGRGAGRHLGCGSLGMFAEPLGRGLILLFDKKRGTGFIVLFSDVLGAA